MRPSLADPPAFPIWRSGAFVLSSDPAATDLDVVCGFLATSYWAKGIPRGDLERSFAGGLVYNLLDQTEGRQIGFARVITDQVRLAYLSDVFVLESHRGRGLGRWMVETIMADQRLAGMRRWLLATADAHGLYRRSGWTDVPQGLYMMR